MCLHIYFQNESLFTFAFNFAQVYAMQLAVLIREYVANLSNIQCMALSFVLVPRPAHNGARGTHAAWLT